MNQPAKRGAALAVAIVAGVSLAAQPALAAPTIVSGAGVVNFENPFGAGDGTAGNTDWMSDDFLPNPFVLGAAQSVGALANVNPWAISDTQGPGAVAWTLSVQLVDDVGDGLPFYGPYNDNGTPSDYADDSGQADVFLPIPEISTPVLGAGVAVIPPGFTSPQVVNGGVNIGVAQTQAPGIAGDGYFIISFPRPMVARVLPTIAPSTTYRGTWLVTLV